VQFTKVVQLERDAARIEGERGALVAAIAQSELKIIQVDEDMRQDVTRPTGRLTNTRSYGLCQCSLIICSLSASCKPDRPSRVRFPLKSSAKPSAPVTSLRGRVVENIGRRRTAQLRAEARNGQVDAQDQCCTHVEVESLFIAQRRKDLEHHIMRYEEQHGAADRHQPPD
jgi:hypothetical protein